MTVLNAHAFAVLALTVIALYLLMIVAGCLRWRDATRVLDSSMIFLTVASLALSHALVATGGAEFLARQLVNASFGHAPVFVMSGLMLLMAALANVISNSAAALRRKHGLRHAMADNCNLLVYTAARYRFKDFVRVGVILCESACRSCC